MKDTIVLFVFLSIDRSLISVRNYFVLEYVAPILVSCWSCNIPTLMECAPNSFTPAEVGKVELNRVVSGGSCRYVYVVARASSDGSPPGFFKISCGDVAMSSAFNGVGLKHPMISGSEMRHDGSLVLMLRSHCTCA